MLSKVKDFKLKAFTPIWTGDVDRKSDMMIPTGLMGSLRWWYEVLVRGLGGKACDPTEDGVRCPDRYGKHCVACELFGCTGWARKFRLMILDESNQVIQSQIKANQTFTLRLIPLRPISDEEWCLLDLTLRIIGECGAIGGKTIFKPSDEQGKENAVQHRDFGLIAIQECPSIQSCTQQELEQYVQRDEWGRNFNDSTFAWASLKNFWCVKGRYLARKDVNNSSFNKVIGRRNEKKQAQRLSQNTPANCWLAGCRQESKKVFSFKNPESARRTFGFVKPGLVDFEEMKNRLGEVWSGFKPDDEFQTAEKILKKLLS